MPSKFPQNGKKQSILPWNRKKHIDVNNFFSHIRSPCNPILTPDTPCYPLPTLKVPKLTQANTHTISHLLTDLGVFHSVINKEFILHHYQRSNEIFDTPWFKKELWSNGYDLIPFHEHARKNFISKSPPKSWSVPFVIFTAKTPSCLWEFQAKSQPGYQVYKIVE